MFRYLKEIDFLKKMRVEVIYHLLLEPLSFSVMQVFSYIVSDLQISKEVASQ